MNRFVHLRCHSHYSLLSGANTVEELIKACRKRGMPALALTDTDALYGAVTFYREAVKEGIKPIIGVELTEKDPWKSDAPVKRVVLLARNMAGYSQLCRLITARQLLNNFSLPEALGNAECRMGSAECGVEKAEWGVRSAEWRIRSEKDRMEKVKGERRQIENLTGNDKERINKEREAAPTLELHYTLHNLHSTITNTEDLFILCQDKKLLEALAGKAAPGSLYVELNYFGDRESGRNFRELFRFAQHLHLPVVATNDAYFADPEGYEVHKVLTAIGANATMTTSPPWLLASPESWLATPEIMVKRFAEFPEALENSLKIADQCHWELELGKPKFPDFKPPPPYTPFAYLRKLALAGIRKRYFSYFPSLQSFPTRVEETLFHSRETPLPPFKGEFFKEWKKVLERLKYELKIIDDLGFATYFLIVWDIVRYARQKGIPTIGRGSAANSLVCYSLGITHVDPLKHNLYFERFLNPERVDCPDIDLDFPWNRRDEVLRYVYDRYGHDHVAMISTFVSFRGRSTIREIGKAMGVPKAAIDRFASRLPFFSDVSHLEEIRRVIPECRGLPLEEEPYKSILRLGRRIEGYPRHLSIHCGGIVISPRPITDLVPLEQAGKGLVITQFNMYPVEDLGLIKIDLLGQRSLAVLVDTLEAVKENYGITLDFTQIDPVSDPATRRLVKAGESMGCFYIESPGMRNLLKKLQVDSFETLVAASSIIRPGVSNSGMMKAFTNRYKGKEKVTYLHPKMEEVLKETFGVMVYQEDVIKVANAVAGMTLTEADSLRKCMSKKRGWESMDNYRTRFLSGAQANGVALEVAQEIWRQIESFGGYAFCKAHSASFAQLSYQTAYLKAHFPAEFMAAVLSNQGGFYHPSVYIEEARRMGLKILLPQINRSEHDYRAENAEPLHLPMENNDDFFLCPLHPSSPDFKRISDRPGDVTAAPATKNNPLSFTPPPKRDEARERELPEDCLQRKVNPGAPARRDAIRIGLMQVKGLSGKSIRSIVTARKERPFSSLADFCRHSRTTYHEIRSLILCGAMDFFGFSRPLLLWQLELLKAGGKIPAEKDTHVICEAALPLKSQEDNNDSFKPSSYGEELAISPPLLKDPAFTFEGFEQLQAVPAHDFSWQEKLKLEEEFLDFAATAHPLSLYRKTWQGKGAIAAKDLGKYVGKRVKLVGWIITSQRTRTVKGEYMKFVTMEDITASFEVTLFPKAYHQCGHLLVNGRGPYLVGGRVENDDGSLTLTADSLAYLLTRPG